MDKKEFALQKHKDWAGKIEVVTRCEMETSEDLSVAYTPGVAEPCLEISRDVAMSYTYTRRHNMVAVVTDGTAVLGLGDIDRKPVCRLWKVNVLFSKLLVM